VSHVDAAVDEQPFELEEHRVVRGVGRVAAEDAARGDDAQGRATPLHGVNLHGRGLRAQGHPVRRVEGVLRAACRVQLRDVERGEVVEVVLDLGAVLHGVAHRDEDVFEPLPDDGDGVEVPGARPPPGQRHVHALALGLERGDFLNAKTSEQI
jgi:hypothetical protein